MTRTLALPHPHPDPSRNPHPHPNPNPDPNPSPNPNPNPNPSPNLNPNPKQVRCYFPEDFLNCYPWPAELGIFETTLHKIKCRERNDNQQEG